MAKSLRSKEYDRITQQIRRAERRGYEFTDEFKQGLKNKTYEELKDISVKDVYGASEKYNAHTGQYQTGEAARAEEIERQKAKRKNKYKSGEIPDYEQAIMDYWYSTWGSYNLTRAAGAAFIIERTEALERKVGTVALARAIERYMADNYVDFNTIAYNLNEAQKLMNGVQNEFWLLTDASEDEIKEEQEAIANLIDNVPQDNMRFYNGDKEY